MSKTLNNVDKIEAKINTLVKSILAKDKICYSDYKILSDHLQKIKIEQKSAEWEQNKETMRQAWQSILNIGNI
jgi:hypothetical protein